MKKRGGEGQERGRSIRKKRKRRLEGNLGKKNRKREKKEEKKRPSLEGGWRYEPRGKMQENKNNATS